VARQASENLKRPVIFHSGGEVPVKPMETALKPMDWALKKLIVILWFIIISPLFDYHKIGGT
jgi:hypothetical protein